MAFLRSILFNLAFYIGSIPLAFWLAPAAVISDDALRVGCQAWARWYLWCSRWILGVKLVVRGAVPQSGAIVAFKHQSMYEAVLTLALFDWPAVVMKSELRGIPLWGYLAERHGSIFVERAKGTTSLRSILRQSRDRIARGRPIVIFPEGTRVPPGERVPIRAGLYGIAAGTGLPVVPVALDAGKVWPKGFVKYPGTVTFAFQPDIPPGLPRAEFDRLVEEAINADPVTCAVRTGAA